MNKIFTKMQQYDGGKTRAVPPTRESRGGKVARRDKTLTNLFRDPNKKRKKSPVTPIP